MRRITLLLLASMLTWVVAAQDIVGSWNGKLNIGAASLRLVFHIEQAADGQLSCTMDSPDQGAKGIPAKATLGEDKKLSIFVPSIGASFTGELKDGTLKGTFSQQGHNFPLDLKPGSVTLNRPQTPQPPYPYHTEEVTFANQQDGAVLSGTLTLPTDAEERKRGGIPVIVMVTGSGLQNRDEESFGHKPFRVIADYFARNGIATLRHDDRGIGKSKGDVMNATTETFMQDALAAIQSVRNDKRFGAVGVLGHSEGGTIAFMLGARKQADFLISMAGCGVKGDSILIEQNNILLFYNATPANVRKDYCNALRLIFQQVASGEASLLIQGDVEAFVTNSSLKDVSGVKENLIAVIRQMNPWMKFFLAYDPAEAIHSVHCPVMAINGSNDTQVLPRTNLNAIRTLLPTDEKHLIKEYPGLNHLFQHCITGLPTEYSTIEETISPEVLSDMVKWIHATISTYMD